MEVYHKDGVNASRPDGYRVRHMAQIRPDFLKECMSDVGNAPLDEFNQYFCVRCQNVECARAGANNSAFNKRVSNWQSLMFDRVPRASESDPRFESIRAKRFLPVTRGRPHEVLQADRPPVIDRAKMGRPPARPPEPAQEQPSWAVDAQEEPPAVPAEAAPPEPRRAPPEPRRAPLAAQPAEEAQNTPFAQGTVIGGGEPAVEKPGSVFVFEDE